MLNSLTNRTLLTIVMALAIHLMRGTPIKHMRVFSYFTLLVQLLSRAKNISAFIKLS